MSTIFNIIRYAGHDHPDGTSSIDDIVFEHADKNDYGYPTNIRWQELFEDLLKRGRWKKPPKGGGYLMLDEGDTFGEVLLKDGTPAGLRLSWYDGVLQGANLFDIPEQHYREALEERLPIGTLILPAGTSIRMQNADGKQTAVGVIKLVSISREPDTGLLLVKTRWPGAIIEEYAHDLHVADIYQILCAVKGLPAPLIPAGMPSL